MLEHHSKREVQASRVVVVGRSGFLAQYLLARLQQSGVPVTALGRPELDLTDRSSIETLSACLQPSDRVVVISALTPDKGRDFRTVMKNLQMAEHLCEVFERRSSEQVVYISSDAVYDGRETPVDENSTRQPVDFHGLMHTAREMLLRSVLKDKGIPLCVLRPVNVYGLGDTHNSYGPNRFIRQAFDARKIVLFGRGEEERNHLHVEDAARLIELCVQHRSAGELNLMAPETVSFMSIAELVSGACGFDVDIEFTPRAAPPMHRPYDATQLHRAFPHFAFMRIEDALPKYVRQYAQQQAGAASGAANAAPA